MLIVGWVDGGLGDADAEEIAECVCVCVGWVAVVFVWSWSSVPSDDACGRPHILRVKREHEIVFGCVCVRFLATNVQCWSDCRTGEGCRRRRRRRCVRVCIFEPHRFAGPRVDDINERVSGGCECVWVMCDACSNV